MSAKGIDRAEIDRIAARINGMYRNRPDPRPSVTRGTVQAVGDYTYDVAMPDGAVLLGVKRTVGAGGASVGDECLIEWIAGSAYVTGVVATADSSHYVTEVAPGVRLVRAGSVGIVQVDYADFGPEKTIIRVAELGVRPVPIGGSGEYTGYMYVRGVAGTLGQLSVNAEGVLCAWVDRTLGAFWSGQVVFAVS